jgi:signal transduction histidine kinase
MNAARSHRQWLSFRRFLADVISAQGLDSDVIDAMAAVTARLIGIVLSVGVVVALPRNIDNHVPIVVAQLALLAVIFLVSLRALPLSGRARLAFVSCAIVAIALVNHWRNGDVLLSAYHLYFVVALLVAIFPTLLAFSASIVFFLLLWLQGVYLATQPLSELVIHTMASALSAFAMALFFKALIARWAKDHARISRLLAEQKRLTAVVSRELRVPAMALTMLTNKQVLTDEDRANMRDAADQLLLVIDNLRYEDGVSWDRPVTRDVFLLRPVLNLLRSQLAPVFKNLGFTLHVDFEQKVDVALVGDASRLRAILGSLLRNVAYYSNGKGIWLDVSLEPAGTDTQTLIMHVEDNGSGVADELLQALRGAGHNDAIRLGTPGLGLWIVKDWIDELGGKLTHGLSPRGGARLTLAVTLPVADGEATSHQTGSSPWQGLQVLIAEGDITARSEIKDVLEHCGADVTEAVNSAKAFDELELGRFDVMILASNLPGLPIGQMLELVKEHSSLLPTVILASGEESGGMRGLLGLGADVVINKPVSAMDLDAAVTTLFALSRLRRRTD